MYSAFLDRTLRNIEALKKHIQTSEALRTAIHDGSLACKGEPHCFQPLSAALQGSPERVEWRIIDHCAIVTRIYAIYENFAHEMGKEHLNLLQRSYNYADLPVSVQLAHRQGIAKILEKKDGPRYGSLDVGQLIGQYHSGLSGQSYELEPKALLIHDQNLRLPELARVMKNCGISDMDAWIEKHRSVVEFFAEGNRLAASATHELVELIKYRNDAAHGGIQVDDLAGSDVLIEFCNFVAVLCAALAERVQAAGIDCLLAVGKAFDAGRVEECLKAGTVLIGPMIGAMSVGSTIFLRGDNFCLRREIRSLQIEGVNHDSVDLEQATELGIGIDLQGRKAHQMIVLRPETPPAGDDATVDIDTEHQAA